MLQLECQTTVLTGEVPYIGVNFQMDVVGRYLIKCLATLLTAPTISTDTVRPQVNIHTMSRLKFLSTLLTTEWSLL